ncbi:Stp1/IreP family PP2C-type Ser/Thr phosphatase [Dictyobacter aurantiacus]|uniref:PPM-type phosphatase domain-containing protein n=1 Tax=Dictyobacter aurantiacus TaxID=1936993 RepID=A0A401ZNG4_9CHLR|nr:Stp1/IreP family PP2C-type Ser/Thr phosphatase [Dictyobacter aurantiacus]GCE08405.1 hypothetical protein KDAU_57340 [Dictyobacter aurantiacus]
MASFHWIQSWSERLYQWLLLAYPSEFRREFGQEMAQTFRDYCREELRAGGIPRLLPLWGTVFYDFMKSVSIEHLLNVKNMFLHDKEYSMLNAPLQLQVAQLTDIGRKRPSNEDNLIAVLPEDLSILNQKGALFVVADGMGGHSYGEVASQIAIDQIREVYYQDTSSDIPTALTNAIKQANAAIYQEAQSKPSPANKSVSMGTTCVAVVIKDRTLYIANVGDSLAYLINDQEIRQLAENHSFVAEQMRKGLMSKEDARTSEQRNVITRALGTKAEEEISLTITTDAQPGDILVLCTDGLHGQISEDEMREIVTRYPPEESAKLLIERANENGGLDNITAIVIKIS